MHFMALQGWRNVVRYVHCDAVRGAHVPGIDESRDGMGIVVFRDVAARSEHVGFAQARQALEADEDAAFAERVNRCGLVAREQVLREGRSDGLKLVRVFRRPTGVVDAQFQCRWHGEHIPRIHAAAGAALVRHVANWPLPPESGKSWGLDCAVVEELWFASIEDIAGALHAEHTSILSAPAADAVELHFSVLVRETVLYPRAGPRIGA